MVSMHEIKRQLRDAGFKNRHVGWSAINQLPAILTDDEHIERAVSGVYDAGIAVFIATNKRILFLDKKPISFKVEDIHYEMISEVEHRIAPFTAILKIHCLSKKFEMTSLRQAQVRHFALFVENKINEIRFNMQTWGQLMEDARLRPNPNIPRPGNIPIGYE